MYVLNHIAMTIGYGSLSVLALMLLFIAYVWVRCKARKVLRQWARRMLA